MRKVAVALLVGFGLGAWFGSERTLRSIRFYSDPENRRRIKRAGRDRRDPRWTSPTK